MSFRQGYKNLLKRREEEELAKSVEYCKDAILQYLREMSINDFMRTNYIVLRIYGNSLNVIFHEYEPKKNSNVYIKMLSLPTENAQTLCEALEKAFFCEEYEIKRLRNNEFYIKLKDRTYIDDESKYQDRSDFTVISWN